MDSFVSQMLDFVSKHPTHQVDHTEVKHQLEYIKTKEHLSSFIAVASVVLAMISLAGVMMGGTVILGAMLAIAGVAAGYSYCCRLAELDLRNKLASQIVLPQKPDDSSYLDKMKKAVSFFSDKPEPLGK